MELKNCQQLKFEETIQSQKIYANNGEIPKNYNEDAETIEIIWIKNELYYNFEWLRWNFIMMKVIKKIL